MSDVEERWAKVLRETKVSPMGVFLGRVAIGVVVGGIATWVVKPYALVLMGVTLCGCVSAFVWRRQKMERREELVDLLMNKISNGMDAKEFVVVLSLLGDMGPSAARALPMLEEIEKANAGTPGMVEACVWARGRIRGAGERS